LSAIIISHADNFRITIRNKIRGITSNEELDRIFDTDAINLSYLLNPVNISNLSTQPYHFQGSRYVPSNNKNKGFLTLSLPAK
jgi:hypothetical protein